VEAEEMTELLALISAGLTALAVFALGRSLLSERLFRPRRVDRIAALAGKKEQPERRRMGWLLRGIEGDLEAAGLRVEKGTFLTLAFLLGGGVAAFLAALGLLLLAALALVSIPLAVRGFLGHLAERRLLAMEAEMPRYLETLTNLLALQPNVTAAVRAAALPIRSTGGLLAERVDRVLEEGGGQLQPAALEWAVKTALTQAEALFWEFVAAVQNRGGEMERALREQAGVLRLVLEARRKAAQSAADAMMTVYAIAAITGGVTLLMFLNPEFHDFYVSLVGQMATVALIGIFGAGYYLARSQVREVA
jgi:Flp pilus assembly protein TadB